MLNWSSLGWGGREDLGGFFEVVLFCFAGLWGFFDLEYTCLIGGVDLGDF